MAISVIIPTLNAGTSIEKLISSLLAQDACPSEIIVIDSSSEDNTADTAKKAGAVVIVIPRHEFNHGRTRNMAALKTKGDILVFMTQDALPLDNTLLGKLTGPLRINDIAAAFGRHVPGPDASVLEVFARSYNYPEKGAVKGREDIEKSGIKTFFFSNVCSAIRREPFFKAGMFTEGIRANEDMLMAARLILNGHKVAYVPEAMVIHSHNYSLLKQFRRYYNIGSSLRSNKWILEHARPEGEGMKFIRDQITFVMKHRKLLLIPYIFLESFIKYAGYRAGLVAG